MCFLSGLCVIEQLSCDSQGYTILSDAKLIITCETLIKIKCLLILPIKFPCDEFQVVDV